MSRKVTVEARDAFMYGRKYANGNTQVVIEGEDIVLKLHGHPIASRRLYRGDVLQISMCGWPTVTTRDRINALLPNGVGISQVKGVQKWRGRNLWTHVNNHDIDEYATYKINTNNNTIQEL